MILEAARGRYLAVIHDELRACDPRDAAEILSLERYRANVLAPDWAPPRPPRRMPDLWEIYTYWADREEFAGHGAVSPVPHCFGCLHFFTQIEPGESPEVRWKAARGYLERAHLITRHKDGLDNPCNLVPACWRCHKMMPRFGVGQEAEAIKWVQDGGRLGVPEEIERVDARLADTWARENGGQYPLWVWMPRARDAA